MERSALFSPCRAFRYRLGRRWGEGPKLCFVLLNPSTADEGKDDPTIRRCIGFAQTLGFGGLEVVNLYAYCATDPAELRHAGYLVGDENDRYIEEAVRECEKVVLAWGVQGKGERAAEVISLLASEGAAIYVLRATNSGHPEHPLRLPKASGLIPLSANA